MFAHLCHQTHARLIDGRCPWCGQHILWGGAGPSGREEEVAVPLVIPRQRGNDLVADLTILAEMAATGARLSIPLQRVGEVQAITLAIPPGIQDGAKLRLRGLGVLNPAGGATGDLFITIHIRRAEA